MPGLVDDRWLQVDEDRSWHVLSSPSLQVNSFFEALQKAESDLQLAPSHLWEEGGKGVVTSCLVWRHLPVWLRVQVKTRMISLETGLTSHHPKDKCRIRIVSLIYCICVQVIVFLLVRSTVKTPYHSDQISVTNFKDSSHLDAMFKTIEFPAGVPDLATGLTHVDRDALALGENYLPKKKNQRNIKYIWSALQIIERMETHLHCKKIANDKRKRDRNKYIYTGCPKKSLR